MKKIIALIIYIVFHTCLWGAYLENIPITITQPNGTVIECFATGDEYYNWAHDENGYTIIQDSVTGYYCYAVLVGDDLVASQYVVGMVSPETVNLQPYINISGEKILEKVNELLQSMPLEKSNLQQWSASGTINNIVVYIRFADQDDFLAEQNIYTGMFNDTTLTPQANSMRNYFREATYSKLDVVSHFYPINAIERNFISSYQDSFPRSYYCPYNAVTNPNGYKNSLERMHRKEALLYNAIDYMKNQVPNYLNLDYNDDGYVDNVCFIVRGETTAWGTPLWPHKSILSRTIFINDKRVWSYNLQVEKNLKNTNTGGAAVLCHEMGHTFGLPDLYHSPNIDVGVPVGNPIGIWDIMADSSNPPRHMSAYMKCKYVGWISSIPSITTSGTYILQALAVSLASTPYPNCYRIDIAGSSQYLVVEYRKKIGIFENGLPGSGLIIYRINESCGGNMSGIGYGGKKDMFYVFRRDGSTSSNGYINDSNFSQTTDRTVFSNSTNPYGFIAGVDYEDYANIYIKNIRENPDGTLSFDVRFCDDDDIIYSNTSYLPSVTNATNSIQTANIVIVKNTDNVIFETGNEVILNSGFEVKLGGTFEINMNECGEK